MWKAEIGSPQQADSLENAYENLRQNWLTEFGWIYTNRLLVYSVDLHICFFEETWLLLFWIFNISWNQVLTHPYYCGVFCFVLFLLGDTTWSFCDSVLILSFFHLCEKWYWNFAESVDCFWKGGCFHNIYSSDTWVQEIFPSSIVFLDFFLLFWSFHCRGLLHL